MNTPKQKLKDSGACSTRSSRAGRPIPFPAWLRPRPAPSSPPTPEGPAPPAEPGPPATAEAERALAAVLRQVEQIRAGLTRRVAPRSSVLDEIALVARRYAAAGDPLLAQVPATLERLRREWEVGPPLTQQLIPGGEGQYLDGL